MTDARFPYTVYGGPGGKERAEADRDKLNGDQP